ncbi:MAG: hypothetical protein E7E42_03540 [Veillonella sp.]|nr:hypothetical protein [Veillonella sp.]
MYESLAKYAIKTGLPLRETAREILMDFYRKDAIVLNHSVILITED